MSFTKSRIEAHLDEKGAATKLELAAACCRTVSAVCKSLKAMRAEEAIYIQDFVAQGREGNVSPKYALGNQPDAHPPAKTNCSRGYLNRARRLAHQQGVGK